MGDWVVLVPLTTEKTATVQLDGADAVGRRGNTASALTSSPPGRAGLSQTQTVGPRCDDPRVLSVRQQMILDFADKRWKYAGVRDAQIRDLLGVSPPRYFQELNALLDHPEALAYAPQLVHRLQRLREQRLHVRQRRSVAAFLRPVP